MNKKLEQRLKKLERRLRGGEITMHFEDGSSRIIPLPPGQDACDLFDYVLRNPHGELAFDISRSVSAVEPGGSRIIEFLRAVLPGSLQTPESSIEIV
jgi:hypothetical protein